MKGTLIRRWREVLRKRTVVLIAIIIGLILLSVSVYILIFKPSPERILVEGKPVEIGSRSLHPEKTKVDARAWFDFVYEPDVKPLWIEIVFIELDVNNTYCFQNMFLNPHPDGADWVVEGSITFGGPSSQRVWEGYRMTLPFRPGVQLMSYFKLRDGNKIDVVLPFYVLKEKVVEGVSFWIDHMYVGELKFSVEVQGEIPPEYR